MEVSVIWAWRFCSASDFVGIYLMNSLGKCIMLLCSYFRLFT